MNHSGDAAEQVVRMALEGVEIAARITGAAAKEIALLLIAALKSPGKDAVSNIKLKGKERLTSMLKSGKALEIFSIKERDLSTFVKEAKNYGVVYCVLRSSKQTPDGLCDVLVKADDAPKINRIVERFKFAAVDKARIESEIVRDMAQQAAEAPAEPETPAGAQPGEPEINDLDTLLDGFFGTDEGKANPESDKAVPDIAVPDNTAPEPSMPAPKKPARTAKKDAPAADARADPAPLGSGGRNPGDIPSPPTLNPSGPSSNGREIYGRTTLDKPSVKKELREIAAARKAKEAESPKREDISVPDKPKNAPATSHKQPQNNRKSKSTKTKGGR